MPPCKPDSVLTAAKIATTDGKLNRYLADIDRQAEEMFSRLVKQMEEQWGVSETLKVQDQMVLI